MARNGFRIFESDTHVGPYMDVPASYLSAIEKATLTCWDEDKSVDKHGRITYTRGLPHYRRRLAEAHVDPMARPVDRIDAGTPAGHGLPAGGYMAGFTGVRREKEVSARVDHDPVERIRDMDYEGVDVNLTLPSGWFGTWTTGDNVGFELAMYRAYHRWMDDYCGAFPERLGGVIVACARDVDASVQEIRRWRNSRWAWALMLYAPYGVPLDHPDLEPIWAEAAALDLAVVLHTFTVMPPYAPGGLDTWENLWLQRSAAHPWCGMRNMAALIGSGVMDRYPELRIGTLEAGHGWLPFWMARIDEHAQTIAAALPTLRSKPSEYVMSGRDFQSIEIPEGGRLTNAVSDLVSDGVLMYASDYPHGESHFPKSVETVLGWDMTETCKRKLFWDNATQLYARSGFGRDAT